MTPTFRLAALSALFFAPLAARADWTGTLKMHADPPPPNGQGDQTGAVSGQGSKMRIDTSNPQMGSVSMIVDQKARKSTMILDAQKSFMTLDLDTMGGRQPLSTLGCDGEVTACLTAKGFTKTGTEVVNGKKSDRWELDRVGANSGEKVHDTLWIPVGVKGFAFIRNVSKSPTRTMTVDVLDFKEGSLPSSKFEVPAGYTDRSGQMGRGMMGPPGGGAHGPGGPGGPPGQ